jgi:hypothetical protein
MQKSYDNESIFMYKLKSRFFIFLCRTSLTRWIVALNLRKHVTKSLKEHSIGMKLLKLDYRRTPFHPVTYRKDIVCSAHVISRRGAVPDCIIEGETVLVPIFQIAVNPSARIRELEQMGIGLYRDLKNGIGKTLAKELDSNVVALLEGSTNSGPGPNANNNIVNTIHLISSHYLTADVIKDALKNVSLNGGEPYAVTMHPFMYWNCSSFWDNPIWSKVKLLLSTSVDAHTIYVTGQPESVGIIPCAKKISVTDDFSAKKQSYGWVFILDVGTAILHNYNIVRIRIDGAVSNIPAVPGGNAIIVGNTILAGNLEGQWTVGPPASQMAAPSPTSGTNAGSLFGSNG